MERDREEGEEPRKRRRENRRLCLTTAGVLLNVYNAVQEEKDKRELKFGMTRSFDRAVAYTGLSRSALVKAISGAEYPSCGTPEERDRGVLMTEEQAQWIRPALVELVVKKELRTLRSINEKLKFLHGDAWNFSDSTLRRAMLRLGFRFQRRLRGYYERMREDADNRILRARYLANYFDFLVEQRPLIFFDETWLSQNMITSKCWTDGTDDVEEKAPKGKGNRWIILAACMAKPHIEDGELIVTGGKWVENSWKIWKGNVQKEDYHSEMNGVVFENWTKNWLLPNIPLNSVIVMDRASYHMMLTEESKGCPSASSKEQLARWLVAHNARDKDGELYTEERMLTGVCCRPDKNGKMRNFVGLPRNELETLCASMKPPPVYAIHKWLEEWNAAKSGDVRVNLLPVGHPQLNPIELAWAQVKQHARARNAQFQMEELKKLAHEKRDSMTSEAWERMFKHVHKFAEKCWEADRIIAESLDDQESMEHESSSEES